MSSSILISNNSQSLVDRWKIVLIACDIFKYSRDVSIGFDGIVSRSNHLVCVYLSQMHDNDNFIWLRPNRCVGLYETVYADCDNCALESNSK